MPNYLLLRDNKQSGPYSLDELKSKGFKKYDLVWLEGKSAAWRYPGELPELKPFAPVIEEQPFDRFFKKPSEQTRTAPEERMAPAQKKMAGPVMNLPEPPVVAETGNKKIYAMLPAKKAATDLSPVRQAQPISDGQRENHPFIDAGPAPVTRTSFLNGDNLKEPAINEKLRKPEPIRGFSYRRYLQPAGLVFSVLALLGTGIFIGLKINQNQATLLPVSGEQLEKQHAASGVPASYTKNEESRSELPAPSGNEKNKGSSPVQVAQGSLTDDTKNANPGASKQIKKSNRLRAVLPDPARVNTLQDSFVENQAGQAYASRQASHRTDVFVEKEFTKNNISDLISISANKYSVGAFGGISDIQLTVSNRSVYPVDLVMVEVQYVQANKKVFKTENVYYRNFKAGESIMQEAPKSPRGVKIQYRIALINSKETGVSYSGI